MLKNHFSIASSHGTFVDILIADAQYLIGWGGYYDDRFDAENEPNLHRLDGGNIKIASILQLKDNEYWIVEWSTPDKEKMEANMDAIVRGFVETTTMPFAVPELALEFKVESGVLGLLVATDSCPNMEQSLAEMRQVNQFKEFILEDDDGNECYYHLLGDLKGKTCRIWKEKDHKVLMGDFGIIGRRYRMVLE